MPHISLIFPVTHPFLVITEAATSEGNIWYLIYYPQGFWKYAPGRTIFISWWTCLPVYYIFPTEYKLSLYLNIICYPLALLFYLSIEFCRLFWEDQVFYGIIHHIIPVEQHCVGVTHNYISQGYHIGYACASQPYVGKE